MRNFLLPALLASTLALGACTTAAPVRTVAAAGPCGSHGYVDINDDGWITGDEWNTWRSRAYPMWDSDRDGRISRIEFERCYRAGGFYRDAYYNPNYWTNYWSGFDVDGDGYLSTDEYWSSSVWTRADRNKNGRIDSDEWIWWVG